MAKRCAAAKRQPQEPKSPSAPLEHDTACELWLLVELFAPVRRRLPNIASQKLVDHIKDRLIANSVVLAKWKKARPELFPDIPVPACDMLPGENWISPVTGHWPKYSNPSEGLLDLKPSATAPFMKVHVEGGLVVPI